jgi:hypothetical protein
MQGASGTREAVRYETWVPDKNIATANILLNNTDLPFYDSAATNFIPNRTAALDVYVLDAAVNLRDQVRFKETTPLQFAYEAADCRIFYTTITVMNWTAL